MSESADRIRKQAGKAKSTSADGVSTTRRSVDEDIKAENYARILEAQESGAPGPIFHQFKPPGGAS